MGPLGTCQYFGHGAVSLGGLYDRPVGIPAPNWMVYVRVADLERALARVKAHGGRVLNGAGDRAGRRSQRAVYGPAGGHVRAALARGRLRRATGQCDQTFHGESMIRIAAIVFAAGTVLLAAPSLAAQTVAPTLDDLGFMAGCWRGDFGSGAALEEVFTAPSANLILGLSRYLRGGRAVQYEFSRITADSAGIALLPYPGGKPSEHAFRLTALEGGRATFEAPEHDFPKRIRYARESDGSLSARIDGGTDDDARAQQWRMRPVQCRPAVP